MKTFDLNLIVVWIWILLGFVSGFYLGSNFHREDWLGGYASLKRRLYRLAHISFFGTAFVNFLFYWTVKQQALASQEITLASIGFIIGSITMPLCCVLMAHRPHLRLCFLIPVSSLIGAGALTLWEILR
jgi:hypothetical protein